MKKLGLFLIICGFFGIAGIASADVSYTRIPSGYYITNPVSVSVSFDNWDFLGPYFGTPNYWTLQAASTLRDVFLSPSNCVASTTLSLSATFNFNIGEEVQLIYIGGYDTLEHCQNAESTGGEEGGMGYYWLEGANGEHFISEEFPIIFTIGVPSLYSLPMASTSDITANVGTLFSDLWVIIATACGIPLGFFVIRRVIGLF